MLSIIRRMKPHHFLILYLCCYAVASFYSLTSFPFVHSDEAWLSGLSRQMLEQGSISVTEPFFDLKPRHPHAIKALFHLLQMGAMALLGYEIGSFRLLSLVGGLAALGMFYALLHRHTQRPWLSLVGTILLSLDVQFVYASHFARSEIWILLGLLTSFYLLTGEGKGRVAAAALVTGLCIGFHPNSFVVAGQCGALLLLGKPWAGWKQTLKSLGLYASIVALFALVFVGLSLWMDPQYFAHYYGDYGADYQVHGTFLAKLAEIGPYFQRLYDQVSGTYYTPDIRLQLWLFAGTAFVALVLLWARKEQVLRPGLCGMLGILTALAFMGRYGQPYVVFLFPLGYLLVAQLLGLLGPHRSLAALSALALAVGWLCLEQVFPATRQVEQYDRYLAKIAGEVPPDGKTLGNLNTEYHFENGMLLDYRNLPYLAGSGLSLEEYLQSRGVEYILYSNELDLLYSLRPRWDHIYGPLDFLPELQQLLQEECTLLYSFVDNQYANRVVSYQHTGREFTLSIYRYQGIASAH